MQNTLGLDNVLYSVAGPMALVTINRPEKHNAISLATLEDLHTAVDAAAAERQQLGRRGDSGAAACRSVAGVRVPASADLFKGVALACRTI